jgi:hypothetical protein
VVRGGYGGARTILELELRAPAANAGTRLARNTRDELNITRCNNAGLLFHAFLNKPLRTCGPNLSFQDALSIALLSVKEPLQLLD